MVADVNIHEQFHAQILLTAKTLYTQCFVYVRIHFVRILIEPYKLIGIQSFDNLNADPDPGFAEKRRISSITRM